MHVKVKGEMYRNGVRLVDGQDVRVQVEDCERVS